LRRPESPLGRAWRARAHRRPSAGIDRGVLRLRDDDPLRAWSEPPAPPESSPFALPTVDEWAAMIARWEEDRRRQRLSPPSERSGLDVDEVADQVRAWEALAELERRASRAREPDRADLLYKQAAVFYRSSRGVLFPAYAHPAWFAGILSGHRLPEAGRSAFAGPREEFLAESTSALRAIRLFSRIEAEGAVYAGADAVAFSTGMCWIRLANDRTHCYAEGVQGSKARRDRALAEGAAAFERCAARFPDSPLSDDAARAASYWRSWLATSSRGATSSE
jgi:hypothetical protein